MFSENVTTLSVDDLAQEIRRIDGNHDLGAGALAEALMPFLALRSMPVASGAVKPMEWKENSHNSVWTGELAFGVYYVAWDEGMGWRAFRKQFLSEASEVEIAYGDKAIVLAAAESDYRNRIMSAITYSVEPVASGQSYDAISKVVHECRNRQRQTGESDQMLSRWITEALSALLPKATALVVSEPVEDDLTGVVTAELLAEHSGCGHGVQIEQVTARLAPGDAVYVVRGKIGKALLVPKSERIVTFFASPQPPKEVTEEMVERAMASIEGEPDLFITKGALRWAIEAAMKEA